MISAEKTVFPIVTFDSTDRWERLLPLVHPELDKAGLNRLTKLLDGRCATVVIERHYIDKDFRDTFSHFHSKRFNTPSSRCVRLHFFAQPVTEGDIVTAGDNTAEGLAVRDAYLGYSIVRPTKPNCIGRTLISHKARVDKGSHICYCLEKIMLLGTEFIVEGFPFVSQDADVTVCAESALWMLFRYFSNRYPIYSEILPYEITSLADHHAQGVRVYPSSGLYSWQLAEALRLHGFSPVPYSRNQYPKNFDHLLYTYIESGVPLLITLPRHVVVGYGHTSDFREELPIGGTESGAFKYTSAFNEALVISDDNHHPYQMLRKAGPTAGLDSDKNWEAIEEFIAPLPERVFLTAEQAQVAFEKLLKHPLYGISAGSKFLSDKNILLRLFLTSTKAFKKKLRTRGMGHAVVEQLYRHLPMPHFIWVCEIAIEEEYRSTQSVWGEAIWDATRNAFEPDGLIALHLPEQLTLDVGSCCNNNQNIHKITLSNPSAYDLYRSNLHTI